jgi:hypothetical protein
MSQFMAEGLVNHVLQMTVAEEVRIEGDSPMDVICSSGDTPNLLIDQLRDNESGFVVRLSDLEKLVKFRFDSLLNSGVNHAPSLTPLAYLSTDRVTALPALPDLYH